MLNFCYASLAKIKAYLFQVKEGDMKNLMFGDFMNPEADKEEKLYEEVRSIDSFYKIVYKAIDEFNTTNKNRMNLVIFR